MITDLKNDKKVFSIQRSIILFIISTFLIMAATQAVAEDFKCRLISGYTKLEVIEVGDEEGHLMGFYERKGLMLYENGEVANEANRGVFDRAKGGTKWQGYCVQTFKDGSTTWMKHQGTRVKDQIAEATFEFIKGTGRFEGIKGQGTITGRWITYTEDHGGYEDLQFTGNYKLPQ